MHDAFCSAYIIISYHREYFARITIGCLRKGADNDLDEREGLF